MKESGFDYFCIGIDTSRESKIKNLNYVSKNTCNCGAGFVGSHLCERLLNEVRGYCLDNFLLDKKKT
jgi:hypothetical protein